MRRVLISRSAIISAATQLAAGSDAKIDELKNQIKKMKEAEKLLIQRLKTSESNVVAQANSERMAFKIERDIYKDLFFKMFHAVTGKETKNEPTTD